MSLERKFRELVSGEWKGPLAAALRGGLSVLERPYRWVVERRGLRFDRQHVEPHRVSCPVVSVGNLTVGGTGKTPLVAWLARWFLARQAAVTIISRGYGSRDGRPNDEALELALELPGVPHLQQRDRALAAEQALAASARQVLILDDAFQHRRLARDLDIVLLDALAPFGYGHLLPRGLLREPSAGLARANVVALSRSESVDEERREQVRNDVRRLAPQALWLELVHRPVRWISAGGEEQPLAAFAGERVAAFCGIGNPAGFRRTLAGLGVEPIQWLELPDHCPYDARTIKQLEVWLARSAATQAVCTRKDLVKIPQRELGGKRLWALEIGLQIVRGQEEFEQTLLPLARRVAGEGSNASEVSGILRLKPLNG